MIEEDPNGESGYNHRKSVREIKVRGKPASKTRKTEGKGRERGRVNGRSHIKGITQKLIDKVIENYRENDYKEGSKESLSSYEPKKVIG